MASVVALLVSALVASAAASTSPQSGVDYIFYGTSSGAVKVATRSVTGNATCSATAFKKTALVGLPQTTKPIGDMALCGNYLYYTVPADGMVVRVRVLFTKTGVTVEDDDVIYKLKTGEAAGTRKPEGVYCTPLSGGSNQLAFFSDSAKDKIKRVKGIADDSDDFVPDEEGAKIIDGVTGLGGTGKSLADLFWVKGKEDYGIFKTSTAESNVDGDKEAKDIKTVKKTDDALVDVTTTGPVGKIFYTKGDTKVKRVDGSCLSTSTSTGCKDSVTVTESLSGAKYLQIEDSDLFVSDTKGVHRITSPNVGSEKKLPSTPFFAETSVTGFVLVLDCGATSLVAPIAFMLFAAMLALIM